MKTRYESCQCFGIPRLVAGCVVALMAVFLIAASSPVARGQDPAQQSQQQPPPDIPPLPLSPVEIAEKNGTALRLSLKDVTKLALQNNLDIAIQDTNEELALQKVIAAYGPYDPTIGFNFSTSSSQSPNTNTATASAAGFNKSDRLTWNLRFDQAIRTGATISANLNANRTNTNQIFALFNPQYGSNGSISFTQPLWRNFRIDQNRGNIKIVNLDLKTNDSQFKQKVTDTISRIQSLYWDLVGTIRDYSIQRESVKLAQISLENNKKKVEIGTLAPIAITEAQAELASREVQLTAAEDRINNVQNNLRALISNDRNAEIWKQTIIPTETPEFKEYQIALDGAIDTAMSSRPELEQLDLNIQKNDINYDVNASRRKWQVDLVAGLGAQGVSTPNRDPKTNPDFYGGPMQSYWVLFNGGFTNWSVGLNLSIPLKNKSTDSQLAQLSIQKRQLLMNRKSLEQQILVEVRNAVQALGTSKKSVQQARVARELAQEQLVGEEKRFQAGLSENFRVLDRQRFLSSAQGQELQALINYKKAVITMQKAMYILLESNDFEMAKSGSGVAPTIQ